MNSISMAKILSANFYDFPRPHNSLKSHSRAAPSHSALTISVRFVSVSALKVTSSSSVAEVAEEDVLRMYFKDRGENGDFISSLSDKIWLGDVMKVLEMDSGDYQAEDEQYGDEEATGSDYDDDGFLKLAPTQEWLLGERSAPFNKKARAKALQDNSDRRKKMNLLKYEALKRELLLLSVSIGAACSGYCLVAFSFQAAVSYATGVLLSCLYLQLLFKYSDNITKDAVPDIFMKKKTKKIGIRSEDLQDFAERTFKGSTFALSSPRLVFPAVIYGLWALFHQHFMSDIFDFQLVPAMLGLFAYKAAALVQVYRDNEDLQLILPDTSEN
ncbi:unnamed protein product [Rhodiola kirilowii]